MASLKKIRRREKMKDLPGISDNYKTWIVSGTSFLSALLVKKAVELIWKIATHRNAPKNPEDRNASWTDVMFWTLVTGSFVNLIGVIIRRNISLWIQENPQPQETDAA